MPAQTEHMGKVGQKKGCNIMFPCMLVKGVKDGDRVEPLMQTLLDVSYFAFTGEFLSFPSTQFRVCERFCSCVMLRHSEKHLSVQDLAQTLLSASNLWRVYKLWTESLPVSISKLFLLFP